MKLPLFGVRVCLGHFEDGVKLVRIGIDPLGLFELF
jgi:hypothetical protein